MVFTTMLYTGSWFHYASCDVVVWCVFLRTYYIQSSTASLHEYFQFSIMSFVLRGNNKNYKCATFVPRTSNTYNFHALGHFLMPILKPKKKNWKIDIGELYISLKTSTPSTLLIRCVHNCTYI